MSEKGSDIFEARIRIWTESVASAHHSLPSSSLPLCNNTFNPRQPLLPTSSNPQKLQPSSASRKRKQPVKVASSNRRTKAVATAPKPHGVQAQQSSLPPAQPPRRVTRSAFAKRNLKMDDDMNAQEKGPTTRSQSKQAVEKEQGNTGSQRGRGGRGRGRGGNAPGHNPGSRGRAGLQALNAIHEAGDGEEQQGGNRPFQTMANRRGVLQAGPNRGIYGAGPPRGYNAHPYAQTNDFEDHFAYDPDEGHLQASPTRSRTSHPHPFARGQTRPNTLPIRSNQPTRGRGGELVYNSEQALWGKQGYIAEEGEDPRMIPASPQISHAHPRSPRKLKRSTPTPSTFAEGVKSSSTSRPASPSKRSGGSITRRKPLSQIDMSYLKTCQPSILLSSVEVHRQRGPLPTMVDDLLRTWRNIPVAFIPRQLESHYEQLVDTPRKSKDAPSNPQYLPEAYDDLTPEQLGRLARVVDRVVEGAGENAMDNAHERQWGLVVVTLLNEIALWPGREHVRAYNIENCAVEPKFLGLTRPNINNDTVDEIDLEVLNPPTTSANAKTESVTKMIDWALCIKLGDEEEQAIYDAYKRMADEEQSMNQTAGWFRNRVSFLDFEVKKETSAVLPTIQLAVWAGAMYQKRRHHQWSVEAPMLGVSVVGHVWKLYITFERTPGNLAMVGPIPMGSTDSRSGVWEILYKLNRLTDWAREVFHSWFSEEILGWCRWKATQPVAADDEM